VDFYKSRGTPESIKAFFRLIYEDDVEIYFPKDDMLIPSDGKWYNQSADIKVTPSNFTPYHTWTISAATAVINFADDTGFLPKLDGDIIVVNGVYEPAVVSCIEQITVDVTTTTQHKITFSDRTLAIGDVVKSYRPGLFTTADGFLSDKKYIQDSKFYQKFSYVLKTGKNIADWKNAFIRLIHPAGFNFFGQVLINITMLTQRSFNQPGYQSTGVPFSININYLTKYLSVNDLGSFIEKTWARPIDFSQVLGLWDHFENIKFINWRPMSDYSNFTFTDVINKNIGTQIGSQVKQCSNVGLSWNGDIPYSTTNNIDYIVDGTDTGTNITYYELNCPTI
jgi:hypothetical protein